MRMGTALEPSNGVAGLFRVGAGRCLVMGSAVIAVCLGVLVAASPQWSRLFTGPTKVGTEMLASDDVTSGQLLETRLPRLEPAGFEMVQKRGSREEGRWDFWVGQVGTRFVVIECATDVNLTSQSEVVLSVVGPANLVSDTLLPKLRAELGPGIREDVIFKVGETVSNRAAGLGIPLLFLLGGLIPLRAGLRGRTWNPKNPLLIALRRHGEPEVVLAALDKANRPGPGLTTFRAGRAPDVWLTDDWVVARRFWSLTFAKLDPLVYVYIRNDHGNVSLVAFDRDRDEPTWVGLPSRPKDAPKLLQAILEKRPWLL